MSHHHPHHHPHHTHTHQIPWFKSGIKTAEVVPTADNPENWEKLFGNFIEGQGWPVYYKNKLTGETRTTPPSGVIAPLPPHQPPTSSPNPSPNPLPHQLSSFPPSEFK